MITLKSHVVGRWVEGKGKQATLVNPATEAPVAQTSTEGIDFGEVLSYARDTGGPALRALTFAERGELLGKLSKALHDLRDPLIEASIENAGTTRSDAKFDVDGAIGTLAYYAGVGKQLGAHKFLIEGPGEQLTRGARFWGKHLKTSKLGAAVHINAFNFPAWGLAEKAAVSLLAGVPTITKPATSTALTAFRLFERVVESKLLPDGALQFVCGSAGDLVERLGPQDLLAFTGGGSTATHLRGLQSVVARSVRVNVEADSLNAMVLGPDASPDSDVYATFLRDAAREITQKTGQKCTATRRILVPAALVDRVQQDLAERLAEVKVGDPKLEEVRMGPLATAQQLRDFRAGVELLLASGARVVHGDPSKVEAHGVTAGTGYFVGALLLRHDAPEKAGAVHAHEVFGPSATLLPYDTAEQAARIVGLGEGGLVASVYTDDRDALETLIFGLAPWSGRVLAVSAKVADQAISPGLVLPSTVHGGPGRAGGGEELGGLRGLDFYLQRTAVQGDRALLDRILPSE